MSTHPTETTFVTTPNLNDSLMYYGDGLFETMLAVDGTVINLDYHLARLQNGCARLEIVCPRQEVLQEKLQEALEKTLRETFSEHEGSDTSTTHVVKLMLSRGEALRGYRTHASTASFAYLSISDYALTEPTAKTLTISQVRLSKQPLLAGLKHSNRLEQIMAKREIQHAHEHDGMMIDEAVMLDSDGAVIEGISHNIFWQTETGWHTPALEQSGVAGTMRAQILDNAQKRGIGIEVETYTLDDLMRAKNVFLTNAVAGIVPVKQIAEKTFNSDTLAIYALCRTVHHPCLNFYSDCW